jgi:hypothetical protein
MAELRLCGARRKNNERCQQPAGRGTDHLGYGTCHLHGGRTPDARMAAARMEAQDSIRVMGVACPTEPEEALQLCVDISRAEVDYCTRRIAELAQDDAVGPLTTTVERNATGGENAISYTQETKGPPAVHIWIRLRREATGDLARFAKMALDADVADRRASVLEREAHDVVELFRKVFDELGLTPEQRRLGTLSLVRNVKAIEGTASEVA